MFIRKTIHIDRKNQQPYHTFKLVEAVRTERGPRQRTLLNLGTGFTLREQHWKDLSNRIEEIITGQIPVFAYSEEIETLARRYARKIIDDRGRPLVLEKGDGHEETKPDYHRVDINTLDNERPRSVGAEYVVHETIKELGLDQELTALGFNQAARDVAIGVITARLVAPSSERAAHLWLQSMTALDELLSTDFSDLSQDRVYKVSDMLLRHKGEIEAYLRVKERHLFNLTETIALYDLTNTFFEGSGKYNRKAHFGHSKERRNDCVLVTLGLVLDGDGFPKKSHVFDGNISEPGTLEGMINTLACPLLLERPMIVMDAGLGTEANLKWLKDHNFYYIVVSRKKKTEMPPALEMITVREDRHRTIQAGLVNNLDTQELGLYCHSTAKELKETGIKTRFERRFEEGLKKIQIALTKKGGVKRYEKVLEKIGRLKERYKRVARRYEITVEKDDATDRVTSVTWQQKEKEDRSGFYCLRSNRLDFKEQKLFDIFVMLTDIEEAFRSMKSELGLRPVYHQKEHRADGHLFITVLAYHVLHTIRRKLARHDITDSWATIRKALSTHERISTTIKRDDGKMIHVRKSSRPEPSHIRIYDALDIPHRAGKTVKAIV